MPPLPEFSAGDPDGEWPAGVVWVVEDGVANEVMVFVSVESLWVGLSAGVEAGGGGVVVVVVGIEVEDWLGGSVEEDWVLDEVGGGVEVVVVVVVVVGVGVGVGVGVVVEEDVGVGDVDVEVSVDEEGGGGGGVEDSVVVVV